MSTINKSKFKPLVKTFRRIFGGVSNWLDKFGNSSFAYVLFKFLERINFAKHFMMFGRTDMWVDGKNFNFIPVFRTITEINGRFSFPAAYFNNRFFNVFFC